MLNIVISLEIISPQLIARLFFPIYVNVDRIRDA